MPVSGFDHVAIPGGDPEALIAFYGRLGFTILGEAAWRAGEAPFFAITFGDHKINVHAPALWQNPKFTLRGPSAHPGCGDFCFVWEGDVASARAAFEAAGAAIIEGPVERQGGRDGGVRVGTSVYARDPDGNLLEFIVYD